MPNCMPDCGNRKEALPSFSCITFGAPLIGNAAMANLVAEGGLSDKFLHVVGRHDVVPRILLSTGLGSYHKC